MTTPQTVLEALRQARALVERGWEKGASPDPSRYCAVIAISRAVGDDCTPEVCALEEECWNALRDVTGEDLLPVWNDAPERTKAEVLAAFDEAIRQCGT